MTGIDNLPTYPDFAPVTLDLQEQFRSLLGQASDPLSEYTFGSLFVFRHKYRYQVALTDAGDLIISGVHPKADGGEEKFFMTPTGLPDRQIILELFKSHDYWRGIAASLLDAHQAELDEWGIDVTADRDDFDYLHLRTDLAELHGDKYQKKRNQIHSFENEYDCHSRPLTTSEDAAARTVLDSWKATKGTDADYQAAIDALELQQQLGFVGRIYYVGEEPVGWWLGELVPQWETFVEHFEKGNVDYQGVYQFINRDMATTLPDSVTFINREQDLGDDGLRQAKMSYHPESFVEKYVGTLRR